MVLTVCLSSRKQGKETEGAEMLMRLFTDNQATFSGWLRKVQTHQVPQVRQEGEPLRRACLQGRAHCPFHTAAPLASTQKPQSLLPRLKSRQALPLKKRLYTTNELTSYVYFGSEDSKLRSFTYNLLKWFLGPIPKLPPTHSVQILLLWPQLCPPSFSFIQWCHLPTSLGVSFAFLPL